MEFRLNWRDGAKLGGEFSVGNKFHRTCDRKSCRHYMLGANRVTITLNSAIAHLQFKLNTCQNISFWHIGKAWRLCIAGRRFKSCGLPKIFNIRPFLKAGGHVAPSGPATWQPIIGSRHIQSTFPRTSACHLSTADWSTGGIFPKYSTNIPGIFFF